ncbi:MAG TPA: hypothetical protein VI749_06965 [Candidatus Omnitrophota bacterium]|nr:hypothetical protein [Candidatus Omnitrophota bacterium]
MSSANKELKLVKETFLKDLVIVTGAPTSGKSMLAPIVGSLERAEHFKMSILLEHLGTLNHLGKLSDEVLVFLLRYIVDFKLYDNMIGREMNMRFVDETSIFNTDDPLKYLDRFLSERGGLIVDDIETKRPLLVLALSDALWHAKSWFEAFPFLKIVFIDRHPVDMVYSWFNHHYGEEVRSTARADKKGITHGSETYDSKICQVVLTQVNGSVVPYYAADWAAKYNSLSEMGRVIYMIEGIRKHYNKALKSLSQKGRERVLRVTFDETVTNTHEVLSQICSFLETEPTPYTPTVLEREKCPRDFSEDERKEKLDEVKALASEEAFNSMTSMVKDYERAKDNLWTTV